VSSDLNQNHCEKDLNQNQSTVMQAVGGWPPRYAPAQACNGSAQRQPWARPAEPGPISQYGHPAGRPHTPTGCTRQMSDRQTSDSIIA